MPVIVRTGDTLLSILRRFNIDTARIPELMSLNHLSTSTGELTVGTVLFVPLPNLGSLLTCTLGDQEQVAVLAEDSDAAPVVMTLQSGDSLEVFTQPIGDWYAAIVHQGSATMSSVYVRVRDIAQLASGDCQQAGTVIPAVPSADTGSPTPIPTATR